MVSPGKGFRSSVKLYSRSVEAGIGCEQVPGEPPEPLVEAVQVIAALNADLLDDLLVEVVEQLLAGVALPLGDLRFQLALELVELELDLLRRAALLVDGGDALLEVHAGLDRAQHLVAGAEDAVEEAELLVEQLVHPLVGGVAC